MLNINTILIDLSKLKIKKDQYTYIYKESM